MERIKTNELARIGKNLANTKNSSISTINGEQMRAVCAIINKIRIAKGWSVLNASDAEISAVVWLEVLNAARVPHTAYDALYQRAMQAKARRMSMGEKDIDLTPDFLVSQWIGENGLAREMAETQKERLLPENAESVCKHCFGSGWKRVDMGDRYSGVIKCDHKD